MKQDKHMLAAMRRGREMAEKILAGDEMLTLTEMAARMDVAEAEIEAMVKAGRLLALGGPGPLTRYPDWQINDKGIVWPGLDLIISELKYDWTVYRFLMAQEAERANLDRLRSGQMDWLLDSIESRKRGDFS